MQLGVDPCGARQDGVRPIHLLIRDGTPDKPGPESEEVMRKLAPLTPHVNAEGLTPFNQICQLQPSAHSDWPLIIFRVFVSVGADLGSRDLSGRTAFQSLASVWQECCSQWLKSCSKQILPYPQTSTDIMHLALDNVPKAGPLHDICTDPSLCISAIRILDEELVYKFLDHSPDVDAVVTTRSILKSACIMHCNRSLILDLLSRSRSSTDKGLGSDHLRLACTGKSSREGCLQIVELLLQAGFDPDDYSSPGESAIMVAAYHGGVDAMKLLISCEAKLNHRDEKGHSVVHYACLGGQEAALTALRTTEVDWTQKANFWAGSTQFTGATAVHMAASIENNRVLEYLLTEHQGFDINSTTDDSETALHVAVLGARPKNVSFLLSKNADANVRTLSEGESPFQMATRFGNRDVIAQFLNHKCDAEFPDASGLSCEMIAWKYGHKEVAILLRNYVTDHRK